MEALHPFHSNQHTRSFGYVGPLRWDKMTPQMIRCIYKNPSGVVSGLPSVPKTAPLRGLWVRTVRWAQVYAFVRARSFVFILIEKLAQRQFRAEFDADGTALLLGSKAAQGRKDFAKSRGIAVEDPCVDPSSLNHSEFDASIEKSMELVIHN